MHSTAVQDQTELFTHGLRLVDSEAVTLPRHRIGLLVPWVRSRHWALLYDEFGLHCNFLWILCLPIFLAPLQLSMFSSSRFPAVVLMIGFVAIFVLPGFAFLAGMAVLSLRAMPWYAVLTLRAAVGLLLCWSRSAGFWGSLLCPANVPGVS